MKRWIGLAVAVVLSLFFLLTPAVAESDPVPAARRIAMERAFCW